MTCGSTYPCPLCYARKGLLRDVGDPRHWSEIISLCEQWMTEGGELEATRKNYKCCHAMPTLGPSTDTKVSICVVPPPLHMELCLNTQLKKLYNLWEGMADWMKSIHVDHVRYHGGKELGKFVKLKLIFEHKY